MIALLGHYALLHDSSLDDWENLDPDADWEFVRAFGLKLASSRPGGVPYPPEPEFPASWA